MLLAQQHTFKGRVQTEQGLPVANAEVYDEVNKQLIQVNKDGFFSVKAASADQILQKLKVKKPNFTFLQAQADDRQLIVVTLRQVALTGHLKNQHGQPIANMPISFWGTSDETRTDALGYFRLPLPAGTALTEQTTFAVAGKQVPTRYYKYETDFSSVIIELPTAEAREITWVHVLDADKQAIPNVIVLWGKKQFRANKQGIVLINGAVQEWQQRVLGIKDGNVLSQTQASDTIVLIAHQPSRKRSTTTSDSSIYSLKNQLNSISDDVANAQETMLRQQQQLKQKIETLNQTLKPNTQLTAEQKADLRIYVDQLEEKIRNNDAVYQQAKLATEQLLGQVRQLLIQDSLHQRRIKEAVAAKDEEQRKREQIQADLQTNVRIFAITVFVLIAITIGAFLATRRISLRNRELRETRAELTAKVKEAEEANNQLVQRQEELEETLKQLKTTQAQLIHVTKMASLGQLTAGVAHELNNPINVIYTGIDSLKTNLQEMIGLSASALPAESKDYYHELRAESEILLASIKRGAERTTDIVRALRTFTRLDEDVLKYSDLHENIDATLLMLRNQYDGRIEVQKQYGDLPRIECFPGQINQVLTHLIENATQAIPQKGTIYITTERVGASHVQVCIRDTGKGIPENIKSRIFEPFFTTKPVGSGTGLGLSITFGIVQNHQGDIIVESTEGVGTAVYVRLPIKPTV
jgi:signal transduction histidine kinase